MSNKFLMELNRIASEEIAGPAWKYECCFCGLKSANRCWMLKHIIGHLKQCEPICSECHEQHLLDPFWDAEELLEAHTETVVV